MLRTLFHWLVIKSCRLLFTITCKVNVVELSPVPRRGALIMASNHISHFDPPIISGFFPRRLDWLAMEEMFRTPLSARIFTTLNCIPVDRSGSDRTSLRSALARLGAGRTIGIFPEGGIRAGTTSILNGATMKPGLAALSIHSGAPIIPCLLLGSDRLYNRTNWLPWHGRTTLILIIGKAIVPPGKQPHSTDAREHFSEHLAQSFISLKEEAITRFNLTAEDLPQTPQARKGVHP
jgi:1-acyl-sn-glycerol-3-phosphate acyltransferase